MRGTHWHAEAVAILLITSSSIFGTDTKLMPELAAAMKAFDNGRYSEAEALDRKALVILQQESVKNNPEIATSLNNLGAVYTAQGKYPEAEDHYRRALQIWQQASGLRCLGCFGAQ